MQSIPSIHNIVVLSWSCNDRFILESVLSERSSAVFRRQLRIDVLRDNLGTSASSVWKESSSTSIDMGFWSSGGMVNKVVFSKVLLHMVCDRLMIAFFLQRRWNWKQPHSSSDAALYEMWMKTVVVSGQFKCSDVKFMCFRILWCNWKIQTKLSTKEIYCGRMRLLIYSSFDERLYGTLKMGERAF